MTYEADEFADSRFSVVHKRATPASYLFPEVRGNGSHRVTTKQ